MKLREIILDFTSLLDVILIILFWFILHYRAQAQQQITKAEQNAAQAVAAATAEQEAAAALSHEAALAQAALENDSAVQAANAGAILEFSRGESLRLSLVMEHPEGWHLEVRQGEDDVLGVISDRNAQRIGLELTDMMAAAGYDPQATVLCIFVYNAEAEGSREAYHEVIRALREVQVGNRHFYYTETDVSSLFEDDGEEELP